MNKAPLTSHSAQDWADNWKLADSLIASVSDQAKKLFADYVNAASNFLTKKYPDCAGNCPTGYFLDKLALAKKAISDAS